MTNKEIFIKMVEEDLVYFSKDGGKNKICLTDWKEYATEENDFYKFLDEFNLDYDAGDYGPPDYIELLKWLEEKQYCENWHINGVFKIHSQNVVGRMNMEAICKKNDWTIVP